MRVWLFLLCQALCGQTIVVSSTGPLKSLAEARDAAREQRRAGRTGTITIQIGDGVYYLPEALALTSDDSNTYWESARGARPVISGGRVITGWKKGAGPLWTADATGPEFHQLFISGRRAQRARTPNYGYFRIDGPSPQDKPVQIHFRGNDIRKHWAKRGDVEVIALLAWADFRLPIVSVDDAEHIATLTLDPRPSNKEADARYYIENAPDALDMAGEWYLDRKTHTVSYWPIPGEDMRSEQVVAPALTQLVRMDGAHNVTFRGLQFVHADWSAMSIHRPRFPRRPRSKASTCWTAGSIIAPSRTPAATRSPSDAVPSATRWCSTNCSISAAAAYGSAKGGSILMTPTRTTRTPSMTITFTISAWSTRRRWGSG